MTKHDLRVVELEPHAPDDDVVQALREVLAKAEAGELVSVAIAAEVQGRAIATTFELGERGEWARLVAACAQLNQRVMDLS